MSDYYFELGVLRDAMADRLTGNLEQTPYVLSEVAKDLKPGTSGFDEFCERAGDLESDQLHSLATFCHAVAAAFARDQEAP